MTLGREVGEGLSDLVDPREATAALSHAVHLLVQADLSCSTTGNCASTRSNWNVSSPGSWRSAPAGCGPSTSTALISKTPCWDPGGRLRRDAHGGTCRPGCDRYFRRSTATAAGPAATVPSPRPDAGHLDAWNKGGHTDLDRSVPACPGHHPLKDLAGWEAQRDPDTTICTWTSPDGRTIIRTHPPTRDQTG